MKIALAVTLASALTLGLNASGVVSKDGKIDFGSKFEARI